MQKVKRIGGIFFKSENSEELKKWYQEHLGMSIGSDGCAVFAGQFEESGSEKSFMFWTIMPKNTDYFRASKSDTMVNYVVESLDKILKQLKDQGVKLDEKIEECAQGRFAWGYDMDGNRFELWEPKRA